MLMARQDHNLHSVALEILGDKNPLLVNKTHFEKASPTGEGLVPEISSNFTVVELISGIAYRISVRYWKWSV